MFSGRQFRMLISDIRFIGGAPILLIAILSPLLIVLFLMVASRYISDVKDAESAFSLGQYYSVVAVSLISAVPFIYGLVFSSMPVTSERSAVNPGSVQTLRDSMEVYLIRLINSAICAFAVVLPVVCITDPVSTEGWLRNLYASVLLSVMAAFICAFLTQPSGSRRKWGMLPALSVLFYLPVPFGLLLHHPWNYLAFYSPFYWINWAWIIPSPYESLMYGLISMALTATVLFILYRKYLRSVREE